MNLLKRLNNPVLFNEWKMRMRNRRSAWMLFFYLLVLGGITLTYIFLETEGGAYFNPNRTRELFMLLSILQLGMIFFVVPGLTAGVISGERERQTLNILLTTNVSATRLILGKWLASLSFMTFLVIATIPLYAIVFLYGGISPGQLFQVFVFYVVTMLGIGSVGVLLSTLIKRSGIATVLSYGIFFCYSIGTLILAEIIRELIQYYQRANNLPRTPVEWVDHMYSINPLFALLSIFGEGPANNMQLYPNSWLAQIDPFWLFSAFFGIVTLFSLLLSIYLIQPVRPRLFKAAAKE
ncbi:ABC transporter permease [Brevibacillus sp. TJ4]|uniref:ABC transporter permease n=1 Tax=Brevibacillus sp. TJ4 TaxID=3234853 RepID=UPI0037D2E845